MTSVSRFKTKNFQTHNRSGVQYNKQLGLFILFTMKCYKTVFTWIQENTFFLYFCISKMMGCLTVTHKIKCSVYRDFSENWIKGVVLFAGKQYTIVVLYYYHNIQLCLANEYTKHKQLKTTSDMHMEQSTWSYTISWVTHQSHYYYYYTYLATFKYIITEINYL